jgi:hypothetical protein
MPYKIKKYRRKKLSGENPTTFFIGFYIYSIINSLPKIIYLKRYSPDSKLDCTVLKVKSGRMLKEILNAFFPFTGVLNEKKSCGFFRFHALTEYHPEFFGEHCKDFPWNEVRTF